MTLRKNNKILDSQPIQREARPFEYNGKGGTLKLKRSHFLCMCLPHCCPQRPEKIGYWPIYTLRTGFETYPWSHTNFIRAWSERSERSALFQYRPFVLGGIIRVRVFAAEMVRKMLGIKRNLKLKRSGPRRRSPRCLFFNSAIWEKVYLVTGAQNWMPAKPASHQSPKIGQMTFLKVLEVLY